MIKRAFNAILFLFTLLIFAGCGGGGNETPAVTYTTATLKINLNGDLAGKAIAGAEFTLTLPADVTPEIANNAVASTVVTPSGTFAGGNQTPPVYTAATGSAAGKIQIVLANNVAAGVTTAGEVATVVLQLANAAAPAASGFALDSVPVKVIDTLGAPIAGMTATVAGVTLQ